MQTATAAAGIYQQHATERVRTRKDYFPVPPDRIEAAGGWLPVIRSVARYATPLLNAHPRRSPLMLTCCKYVCTLRLDLRFESTLWIRFWILWIRILVLQMDSNQMDSNPFCGFVSGFDGFKFWFYKWIRIHFVDGSGFHGFVSQV